jgi:excisionase family DNA binding protein
MAEQLYTIGEVARLLKVSRKTLYAWMNDGKLPYVVVGYRRRIAQSALDTLIGQGRPVESAERETQQSKAPSFCSPKQRT